MNFLTIAARMTCPEDILFASSAYLNPELFEKLMNINAMLTLNDSSDYLRSTEVIASIVLDWIKKNPDKKPYLEA